MAGQGLDNVSPVWYKESARFRGVSGPAIGSLDRGNRDPARQPPGESQTPKRGAAPANGFINNRRSSEGGEFGSRMEPVPERLVGAVLYFRPQMSHPSSDGIALGCHRFVSVSAGCLNAERGTQFARGCLLAWRFSRAVSPRSRISYCPAVHEATPSLAAVQDRYVIRKRAQAVTVGRAVH